MRICCLEVSSRLSSHINSSSQIRLFSKDKTTINKASQIVDMDSVLTNKRTNSRDTTNLSVH